MVRDVLGRVQATDLIQALKVVCMQLPRKGMHGCSGHGVTGMSFQRVFSLYLQPHSHSLGNCPFIFFFIFF